MLGPALLGEPTAVSAWLWNIRANPYVRVRVRGGTFEGIARELDEGLEMRRAKEIYCGVVHAFDYLEGGFHLRGCPTRGRIERMHRRWFDDGIPLELELL
ncbi:MAG TPA: nitroreductase/quinone reductase family protein [Solirubrobacteraceae bacterium]|nr:nitroreductase/quinone reductase family protein [Solirubrobacteraceae bacterium]